MSKSEHHDSSETSRDVFTVRNTKYDYVLLNEQIRKLGPENSLKNFLGPFIGIVSSLLFALSSVVLAHAMNKYEIASWLKICAPIVVLFIGIACFIHCLKKSRQGKYEERKKENSKRRNLEIYYILIYYFVKREVLDVETNIKGVSTSGIEATVDKIENELNDDIEIDVDYLIDKFDEDRAKLLEKTNRSILIAFIVTLAVSGVEMIKDFSSWILWQGLDDKSDKIAESAVSLSGNFSAFVALIVVVLFIVNAKDTIDLFRQDHINNYEYAILSLKRIKSYNKHHTQNAN